MTAEINFKSQNLRKTNAFEELERKREEALRAMYNAKPPPHKFGRKTSEAQFPYERGLSPERKVSKCKSMSSIAATSSTDYKLEDTESESEDHTPPQPSVKRSKSFNKEPSSEEEKAKKKPTMFSALFKKKTSKSEEKREGEEEDQVGSPKPIPRAQTLDNNYSHRNGGNKSKVKISKHVSLDEKGKSGKKGKNR